MFKFQEDEIVNAKVFGMGVNCQNKSIFLKFLIPISALTVQIYKFFLQLHFLKFISLPSLPYAGVDMSITSGPLV